ncbi:MAG: non-ribosomal peptide synthetase, partial [Proteobacteria bacterium]|nr:non-ribosomal peptide synthetase [Pseudomonadota bacterium]
HQIKISGYRVELGEIEQQLMKIEAVAQASVVDCINSQGAKYLSAFLVCETVILESDIKKALGDALPYYMVPSSFHFLEELPTTSNGKVDRKEFHLLEKDSFAVVKNPSRMISKSSISSVEESLNVIWKEILAIEKCDREKNFFDLGGHSLQVVELQNRILRDLAIDLPVTDLFTYSTLKDLSAHIESIKAEKSHSDAEVKVDEEIEILEKDDIAIIGMAGRFPGASNIDEFWENLKNGTESITTFTKDELLKEGIPDDIIEDSNYVPSKGYLKDSDLFDAHFFDFNPRDAELTDPQHRIFLQVAFTAIEHAGYDYKQIDNPVGVFASTGFSSYLQQNIGNESSVQDRDFHQVMIGNDKDFIATRVAYKLNLTGPAQTIQTACSSSLVNVNYACESLNSHNCDMALAGGVNITMPLKSGYLYSQDGIASPNGQCRPFDSEAKGTVPGNGAGVVLLKRLKDAQRDGDTIYALIKSTAVNNDGSGKIGFTAPSVVGQKNVMQKALENSKIPPESIGFIEAHGTGTSLGDPIEFKALSEVYSKNRSYPCAIGAVKGNVGHLDSASGVTGLIKAALSLYHKTIVPTVHFQKPNKALHMDEKLFFVANSLQKWESSFHPRRAAVSSLGLGGTNAHAILEQAPKLENKNSEENKFSLVAAVACPAYPP